MRGADDDENGTDAAETLAEVYGFLGSFHDGLHGADDARGADKHIMLFHQELLLRGLMMREG